jgi:hypothetical protein
MITVRATWEAKIQRRYSERKFLRLEKKAKRANLKLVKALGGFRIVDMINQPAPAGALRRRP